MEVLKNKKNMQEIFIFERIILENIHEKKPHKEKLISLRGFLD